MLPIGLERRKSFIEETLKRRRSPLNSREVQDANEAACVLSTGAGYRRYKSGVTRAAPFAGPTDTRSDLAHTRRREARGDVVHGLKRLEARRNGGEARKREDIGTRADVPAPVDSAEPINPAQLITKLVSLIEISCFSKTASRPRTPSFHFNAFVFICSYLNLELSTGNTPLR